MLSVNVTSFTIRSQLQMAVMWLLHVVLQAVAKSSRQCVAAMIWPVLSEVLDFKLTSLLPLVTSG